MLTSAAVHLALLSATVFALYPLLWVLSTALSHGELASARALPLPESWSLEHFRLLLGDGTGWLFARQRG